MNSLSGLRVAYLCSADSYRGSAVSFEHLALGLTKHGGVARIFTGHAALTEPLRAAGIDVRQLDLRSTNARTAFRIRAELKEFRADVLVVDRPRDVRLGMLGTYGTRTALVSRYNAHAPRPPRDPLIRLAYRFGVRSTVFLTHEMAQRVLHIAPWMARAGHRVIPEGVDVDLFRPDADAGAEFRQRHQLGSDPLLLSVSALTSEKRIPMILDAMRLTPEPPTLVLCGEGPQREDLAALADMLDLSVRFLGRIPREELVGAYNATDVLVHACDVETFGLSVLEAMACGCPVVGVRAGGLREVVGENGIAGILVAPDDPEEMARAVSRLLTDHAEVSRLRLAARARAVERFALPRMQEEYSRAALDVRH
jgi:glycosyltransferase involved in cell wall biosynthesis